MTTMRFTPAQMEWFTAYEFVRDKGKWNMFDQRAQQAAGLATEEYIFVMKNYSEMLNQANEPN